MRDVWFKLHGGPTSGREARPGKIYSTCMNWMYKPDACLRSELLSAILKNSLASKLAELVSRRHQLIQFHATSGCLRHFSCRCFTNDVR